jgi:MFS family permease
LTPRDGFDRKLLAPLISGAVLNPINSTVIAVALVPIGVAFGEPASATAWLISSLYVATAIGQPVVGRLIDTYGPRRLFLPATALVGVAGVIGTLAPNLGVLILARVILGFGTCAGYPAAMRLIRDESRRTGRDSPAFVLTVLAVSTQTVAVIGPALGGLLIGLGGWRTTFALNIPLALFAFTLGAIRFPKEPVPERPARTDPKRSPGTRRWNGLRVLAGNTPLMITYGRAVLAYVVSYSFIYGYTQWLEHSRGLSPSQAGLATLPLFLTGIVVSLISGRRMAVRGKLVVAAATQIVGCALLLTLHSSTSVWLLIVVALVFGVPQGLNSLALQNSVYRQADPDHIGASAGLLRTFGYLGAIISSVAQGAFYGEAADTSGMHHLAYLLVGVGAVFLLITVFDRSLARSTTTTDPQPEKDMTHA